MEIVWSDQALREEAKQLDWYAELNPSLALRMSAKVERQVDLLASFPRMGRLEEVTNLRLLTVHGTPFVLAYRVEQVITIVRLFHQAQDWPAASKQQGQLKLPTYT